MAMRDGAAYLAGLKDQRRIWHNGALVDDVTTAPGFANAAHTIAAYYDFQCDPANQEIISYEDEDGQRSHRSFKIPRSREDLRRRSAAYAAWAEHTGGQLGRAPDYMNAAMAGVAAASHHWGQNDPQLGKHAVAILDHCRRNDVCLTHTFVTPQIDRKTPLGEQEPYLNAGVVKRTSDGVIVRGSRVLGTLAPFCDENVSFGLPIIKGDAELKYALGFTIPSTPPACTGSAATPSTPTARPTTTRSPAASRRSTRSPSSTMSRCHGRTSSTFRMRRSTTQRSWPCSSRNRWGTM